ncbi:hypothetical protein Q5W_02190 [Hydrogenophaga sp. PBC]|nr:hypothetical protein Q5W_02190 [Hydrogenophaga sp. PBC]
MQTGTVFRTQYGTAASGHHRLGATGDFVNDLSFKVPERRLPFTIEIRPDARSDALFDHLIGVDEGQTQSTGQLAPDGGFA